MSADCGGADAARIDDSFELNAEAVVQDLGSSRCSTAWKVCPAKNKNSSAWDCCAASGSRSICSKTAFSVRLTVSDVQESVVANLKKRFAQAGIRDYNAFVADVAAPGFPLPVSSTLYFAMCLAPVPALGPNAGTTVTAGKIRHYASLQRRIVQNAVNSLAPGGLLVYCTCSVFKENEEALFSSRKKSFRSNPCTSTIGKGTGGRPIPVFRNSGRS